MDRSILMNMGNRLRAPYEEVFPPLEPLRQKALDARAPLSAQTDYNVAFEHARKRYEAEAMKSLVAVEEQIDCANADIKKRMDSAEQDRAAAEALSFEKYALEQQVAKIEAELNSVDAQLQKTQLGTHTVNPAEEVNTDEAVQKERAFYEAYEKTFLNARTASFRMKNKLSIPTEDELEALRHALRNLEALQPANATPYTSYVHEVEKLIEDVTVRASCAVPATPLSSVDETDATDTAAIQRQLQEEDFMKESAKLLHWCRQQKTDLEALTEPDHIQKFCSALEVNYKTMYDNFEMLSAMGQELIGKHHTASRNNSNKTNNKPYRVETTLMECNEVWLNLLVYAHEVLQHTMLEIHARSKLEDEVRAFSSYSMRFRETLSNLKEMFSLPMDEESKEVVAGVLRQTESLQQNFEPFADLAESLKEFSLRMECLRDNYHNLRRTVLARITFLTAQNPTQQLATATLHSNAMRARRLEEYNTRMKELNEWVSKKGAGESASDIHARIEAIKVLVDREYETVMNDMKQMSTYVQ